MGRTYYYARVSSADQHLDRQIAAFKKDGANDNEIFTEKQSGASFDRPTYQLLRRVMSPGDTLVVMSLDRLGRTKSGIKNELEYYRTNHIRVKILDLPTTCITAPAGQESMVELINDIIIEVLAYMAENERKTIRERQAQGIEIAKSRGAYTGRKPIKIDEKLFENLNEKYKNNEINATQFAAQLGVSRNTFYRIVRRKQSADDTNAQ